MSIDVQAQWTLKSLLTPYRVSSDDIPELPVSGLSLDSRLIQPGDVYLALKGATTHGIRFAQAAIELGAVAVIAAEDAERLHPEIMNQLRASNVVVVEVPGLDTICAELASRFYDYPDNAMTLIAVTGTDGKTSVCRFLAEAFELVQFTCGYIGTVGWGVGDSLKDTQLTTPDVVTLRRMLASLREQGAQFVALEASSHGIAEGRLDGLSIDVAVLTNLGRDHLDYHGTLDAYRQAKARLFFWNDLHSVVLNVDSDFGRELLNSIAQSEKPDCYAYSGEGSIYTPSDSARSSINASSVLVNDTGLTFSIEEYTASGSSTNNVASNLLGRFNVDNLLACYCTLRACGVAANDASYCVSTVKAVAGRMERFGGDDQPTVVVDFCHTPQALEVALNAVRVHASKEIWVVFGCGGDRDSGKRSGMARAAEAADHVVLTDDNPRTEQSQAIIDDAMAGFEKPDAVHVIADRSKAIQFAVSQADAGDLVLIAGKGHEDYQIIGTTRYHFSDREQALLALGLAS